MSLQDNPSFLDARAMYARTNLLKDKNSSQLENPTRFIRNIAIIVVINRNIFNLFYLLKRREEKESILLQSMSVVIDLDLKYIYKFINAKCN